MVLPFQSSGIPATLKAGRNVLVGSDTPLKLTLLSLHPHPLRHSWRLPVTKIHFANVSDILGEVTCRTWWKHIDSICPTFASFPYSSVFLLYRQSPGLFKLVSLASVLAKSIQECSLRNSQCRTPGFLKAWCPSMTRCRIHFLLHCRLQSRLDHSNHKVNEAKFLSRICCRVR